MKNQQNSNFKATYCQSLVARTLNKYPNSGFYFAIYRIKGNRDVAKSQIRALQYLFFSRHPVCNAIYHLKDDGSLCGSIIQQTKNSDAFLEIEAENWSASDINQYLCHFFEKTPLNIDRGPITRLFVFYTSSEEFVFALCSQHIAFDTYSFVMIRQEMEALMKLEASCQPYTLPPVKADFLGYAAWEKQLCSSNKGIPRAHYWRETLNNYQAVDLPIDYPRDKESIPTLRPLYIMTRQQTHELRKAARGHGCTISTLMTGAYMLTLSLFSKQQNIVICSLILLRLSEPQFIHAFGNIIDYLPIAATINPKLSLQESIKILLGAQKNSKQNYLPLGRILEELNLDWLSQPTPLVQCFINYMPSKKNIPPILLSTPEENNISPFPGFLEELPAPFQAETVERQEMALFYSRYNGLIRWRFSDRVDLFKPESMERIEKLFLMVLTSLFDKNNNSTLKVSEIEEKYPDTALSLTVRDDC